MTKILLISGFGVLGVLGRYGLDLTFAYSSWPLSTLIANISGSFLIGLVYGLGQHSGVLSEDLRVGLTVGLLGGFTTFSSFALQAEVMLGLHQFARAFGYMLLSPIVGMLAAWAGIQIVSKFV
jgi:fluoride exporter